MQQQGALRLPPLSHVQRNHGSTENLAFATGKLLSPFQSKNKYFNISLSSDNSPIILQPSSPNSGRTVFFDSSLNVPKYPQALGNVFTERNFQVDYQNKYSPKTSAQSGLISLTKRHNKPRPLFNAGYNGFKNRDSRGNSPEFNAGLRQENLSNAYPNPQKIFLDKTTKNIAFNPKQPSESAIKSRFYNIVNNASTKSPSDFPFYSYQNYEVGNLGQALNLKLSPQFNKYNKTKSNSTEQVLENFYLPQGNGAHMLTEPDSGVYQQRDSRNNQYVQPLYFNNGRDIMNHYSMGNEIDFLKQRLDQAEERALIEARLKEAEYKRNLEEEKERKQKSSPKVSAQEKKSKKKKKIVKKSTSINHSTLEEVKEAEKVVIEPEIIQEVKEEEEQKVVEIINILKQEAANLKKIHLNIKTVCWFMAYPALLKNQIKKNIDNKRQKIDFHASKDVKRQVNSFSNYLKKYGFGSLRFLYEATHSLNIVPVIKNGKPKPLDKKIVEKRSKLISENLKSILSDLLKAITNVDLPVSLLEYFSSISENKSLVPGGLLFQFEISRLEVTEFLTLKNMDPMKSKMIIGMFFIVRMVIFCFLTKPEAAKVKIEDSPVFQENLKICSSVLYHIVMSFFREHLPIITKSRHNKKLKAHEGPLFAFDEPVRTVEDSEKDEVILGLYNKDMLKDYLKIEEASIENINDLIQELLELLYSKIHSFHLLKKAPQENQE